MSGIVFHICEHVDRHIQRYRNQDIQFNRGIEDYFPNREFEVQELTAYIESLFRSWGQEIDRAANIDMHSLYHLIEHTGYHLGQIVDRTRRLTEKEFRFCQHGINERALREGIG